MLGNNFNPLNDDCWDDPDDKEQDYDVLPTQTNEVCQAIVDYLATL